ncbi:helix-turn-helix domain-containing protein [Embleya sp. MST-111070]|uniref:helix-turn-helix domain-containing protein n=1 Tax=Embleya sp. MST-111070 TaxID=3398231 RepID=UPI003F73DE52
MSDPITDEDRHRVCMLHAAGRSRNEIAREIGRSGSTVSKIAAAEGLTFDRAATTAPAVEARRADLAAVRLDLQHRLYARAADVLARVEAPTYVRTEMLMSGQTIEVVSDDPPAQDERHLAQSIGSYLTSAQRLADVDAGNDSTGVRSMLVDLARGIRSAFDDDDEEADEEG